MSTYIPWIADIADEDDLIQRLTLSPVRGCYEVDADLDSIPAEHQSRTDGIGSDDEVDSSGMEVAGGGGGCNRVPHSRNAV